MLENAFLNEGEITFTYKALQKLTMWYQIDGYYYIRIKYFYSLKDFIMDMNIFVEATDNVRGQQNVLV